MTENMEQYDVLVIGGGPGGYSLGIAAAKKGLKVALFEKEHLGGTCLNVGCIPTKYLVDKANAMEKVRALVKKDIFRDAGSFSFKKIQQGKGEVTAKLVGGVKYLLKKAGADVITGEATLKADRVVSCGGKDYQGKYVVIATGSVPMMIPVPGYELCIDSTGALNLPSLPRSMVVMGGGVIGLELACAFAAYGTEITVVEMMPELMPREQKEAVRIVVNALKKQGIALKTGAKMLRIEKNGGLLRAVYEIEGKEEYTDCEQVLMAAGRKTNLSGIDAEALGLELDRKKCIVVDKYQHTSLPGVYAIGDVVGGYQLAHAAYAEGEAALAEIRAELKSQGYLKYYKAKDKKQKPADFLRYVSSDGFPILVGRNNAQNDRLTLKTARGRDVWFHVKNAPGSHAVVLSGGQPVPDTTKTEAAVLAAVHSSQNGGAKVQVE